MAFQLERLTVSRAKSESFRDPRTTRTIQIGDVTVGGRDPVVIAGPCAVESLEQTLEIAERVAASGAHMLRGGAYKPRTSPYDFQGLGEEGLKILAAAREKTGLPIVTEVMDPRLVELVGNYADVLQIGTRNMQNTPLLIEVGRSGKPVLLKRGMSATIEEWLLAAEYIATQGNLDIMLCERGIRTFADGSYNRSTLDLGVIQPLRAMTYLPVLVDPSHAMGKAELVPWACHASIACGAQGLLIEVIGEHADRSVIRCDGGQGIRPQVLDEILAAASSCRMHAMHLIQSGQARPFDGSHPCEYPHELPSCPEVRVENRIDPAARPGPASGGRNGRLAK